MRDVLQRFRADDCSFLTPPISALPDLKSDTRIDVGHEALLRRWERVRGDPDAPETDDAPDAAIGWLRAEERDAQRYRSLLALLDNRGQAADNLPPRLLRERWAWWNERSRTAAWAERYGGRYEVVKKLLEDGVQRARRIRVTTWAGGAFVALLILAIVLSFRWVRLTALAEQRIAEENFRLLESSTNQLLGQILISRNAGDISVKGAKGLLAAEETIVTKMEKAGATPDTKAIRAWRLMTAADVYAQANDAKQALKYASEAESIADQLVQTPPVDPERRYLAYAAAMRTASLVAGSDSGENHFDRAIGEYRKARDAIEMALTAHDDISWRLEDGIVHGRIAELLNSRNSHESGEDRAQAAEDNKISLSILEDLAHQHSERGDFLRELASEKQRIGHFILQTSDPTGGFGRTIAGPPDQAVDLLGAAFKIRQDLVARYPDNDVYISNLSSSHTDMALLLENQGRWDEAMPERRWGMATYQRLAKKDPSDLRWKNYLARTSLDTVAALKKRQQLNAPPDSLRGQKYTEEIVSDYSQALAIRVELADRDRSDMSEQGALGAVAADFGDFLLARQRIDEAVDNYRLAVAAREQIANDPTGCDDKKCWSTLASAYMRLADALLSRPQHGSRDGLESTQIEALDFTRKALALSARAGGNAAADPGLREAYARAGERLQDLQPGP